MVSEAGPKKRRYAAMGKLGTFTTGKFREHPPVVIDAHKIQGKKTT